MARVWLSRVAGGIATMLAYAILPTVLALVVYLLDPDAFGRENYPSLQALLSLYLALGVVGGSALGLLRQYAKGRLRTALVSIGVALPMTLTLMLYVADWRPQKMEAFHFVVAVFLAVVFGPLTAAYVSWQSRRGWNPP